MSKFWDLLEESVIFQGLLLIMVFGTVCFLVIQGRDVPKELWGFSGVIVGFFFGAKAMVAQQRAVQATIREVQNGKRDTP